MKRAVVAALAIAGAVAVSGPGGVNAAPASDWCGTFRTTGYVRGAGNPHTKDGTSIYADIPIVSAGPSFPFGTVIEIENVGTFVVHDRGSGVGDSHLDVAVWTLDQAYKVTGNRRACVYYQGGQS